MVGASRRYTKTLFVEVIMAVLPVVVPVWEEACLKATTIFSRSVKLLMTLTPLTTYLSPRLFFQAEDGIRYYKVTGVQTCALPICSSTYWRLCVSRTTDSIPSRCRRGDNISPAGPAPIIPTWVCMLSRSLL